MKYQGTFAGRDEYQLKFFKNSIRTELGVDVDDYRAYFDTPQDTLKAVNTAVRVRTEHQMGYLNEGCGLATTATVQVTSTEELMMPSRLSCTPQHRMWTLDPHLIQYTLYILSIIQKLKY